jgi:dUTP pyrophosphatase
MISPDRIASFEKISFIQYFNAVGSSGDVYGSIDRRGEYEAIKLPKRATNGSAGYDFYSPIDFSLLPGESIKINTGIRCKISDWWVLMCFPRSGLGFKFRVQLDNTVAIIDSDYYNSDNEGHIMLKLTNDCKSDKTMSIKAGEGIAQGVFLQFGITEDDNTTTVRNGGLGSTTKIN